MTEKNNVKNAIGVFYCWFSPKRYFYNPKITFCNIPKNRKAKKKKNLTKIQKNLKPEVVLMQIFLHFCGEVQGRGLTTYGFS